MKKSAEWGEVSLYDRIYRVTRLIPAGTVATYGQIAEIVGDCGPRNVGYALSALAEGNEVPWHRVINSKGEVSPRSEPGIDLIQRQLLELEGVEFDEKGQVDFSRFGWDYVPTEEELDD